MKKLTNIDILKDICVLHNISKEYLLRCETLAGKTILQPIKEYRDAYDHLLKTFFLQENSEDLISNLNSAYSHEFRAFMDVLDYYCLTLLEKIDATNQNNQIEYIKERYPNYSSMVKYLFEAREKITQLRFERKKDPKLDNRKDYIEVADKLNDYYKDFVLALIK